MPRVSIVVPAYNAAAHLESCLRSLVAQTFTDREILVLDDASTDATPAIAEEFAPAVTLVRQPANRGQFRNVEEGLRRATGEFVAVFHADDLYDHAIVAELAAALDRWPEVGLVFALDRFIDGEGREYGHLVLPRALRGRGPLPFPDVLNGVLTYKNVFMPTPGAMARRSWYRCVGPYRTEFGSAADLDMWLRLSRLGPVLLVERHLFSYRHTTGSEGQAYQRLRVDPENYFAVMDRHLAEGADAVATPAALRAYTAHRAVDGLRTTVNAYLRDDRSRARANLREVRLRALLGSAQIRRPRHLVLYLLLQVLVSIPRQAWLARILHWRFYRRLPWWREAA